MNFKKINSPGRESQTALATKDRYENQIELIDCGEIEKIPFILDSDLDPFVVPIWNSNLGEVKKSDYVWNYLVDERIFIHDLWAKEIEFWHVKFKKTDSNFNKLGVIGKVADIQCASYKAKLGKEFIGYSLSSKALEAFRAGAELDGVLIAPYDETNLNQDLEIVSKDTVEPFNFTSFATIQHINHSGKISHSDNCSYLTALEIKPLTNTIPEAVSIFFDNLINQAVHINDVPKLLFVFDRESKAGLLFQSTNKLAQEDFFDIETIEENEVGFHSGAGQLDHRYDHQLELLLTSKFPDTVSSDFVLHRGSDSYLFICKSLGIYTHGYEENLIAPVFRYYVHRVFDAINRGLEVSTEQANFFNKYKNTWLAKGAAFINFAVVSTASSSAMKYS